MGLGPNQLQALSPTLVFDSTEIPNETIGAG